MTRAISALGMLLACVSLGCNNVETSDISAAFVRRADAGTCGDNSGYTGGGGGGGRGPRSTTTASRPMDTYVVRLLEFDDSSAVVPDMAACVKCAAGVNCHVEQPTCLCSAPVATSPDDLGSMLSGFHFGALDYGRVYCLQVLAIDRAAAGTTSGDDSDDSSAAANGVEAGTCKCDDRWTAPSMLPTDARLCALSVPYAAGPLSLQLDVECRSDGSLFTDCLGLSSSN